MLILVAQAAMPAVDLPSPRECDSPTVWAALTAPIVSPCRRGHA